MKTFIRRPGNKTRHLKHIIPNIPKFLGTYYEPFVGTGAVYLHLLPSKAVLNDINTDIINIWKLVKTNPSYIISEIDKFKKVFLPKTNEEKLKFCKELLVKMKSMNGDKRTVLYLLLVYCSFKGTLYLTNRLYFTGLNGHIYLNESCHIFTQNYKEKIILLSKILKNVKIENKDYSKILKICKKGDFVFLDPPYIEDKKYSFNYNKDEQFNPEILRENLEILDNKNVKWMMTQIDTPQVRKLFKKYKFRGYINNGSVNRNTKGKKELIITNY